MDLVDGYKGMLIENFRCSKNFFTCVEVSWLAVSCNVDSFLVSSVLKLTLSEREVWGSIPGPVESAQCRQRLATVATFLWSCVSVLPGR